MDDFNFWGAPRKKKKEKSILDIGSDFSLKPSKKQKNPFALGRSDKPKRDTRRAFTQTQKKEIQAQQNNKCARCKKVLDPREIEFDHKKPWTAGGKTTIVNGRALCASCHKIETHKTKLKQVDKKRKPKKQGGLFGGLSF